MNQVRFVATSPAARPTQFIAQLLFGGTFILIGLLLYAGTASASALADPDKFPEYNIISANVAFWEKVYSTYSVNTSIIHDQNDLSRVYATVSLSDEGTAGAQEQNRLRVKRAKQYVSSLLIRLSMDPRPKTPDEQRIVGLFGAQANSTEFKRAAENLRSQIGLKERFIEGVIRSGAYMADLKLLFRSAGLPEDLAYLPHVESSFNPKAFSKFGAAGMWQFTQSTGKEFLTINYIIDERRDPLISARAAATFLKRNYQQLGTWPLALTAYNYGPAGMKRALDQEGSYERIFKNYRKGYFKFASRNFYSEFLAAVKVAKMLERSGLTLDQPLGSVAVRLPAYTRADKLCAYLGISTATLHTYNPALRDPVFKGTKYIPKDYLLKLPYKFNNSTLLASAPSSIFSSAQKRSQFYRVRAGDSAGAIAQRHKVSLDDLVRANNLNSRAVIRVGQNLRIPAASQSSEPIVLAAAASPNDAATPTLKDNKKQPAKEIPGAFQQDLTVTGNLKVFGIKNKNSLTTGSIEVQPDESIGLFADWLKVTPGSIRINNNLSKQADVYPGQEILLDFINTEVSTFEENRFDFHQEKQEDFFESYAVVGMTNYRVKQGDTIWDICRKEFDVPLWLLKKYNEKLNYSQLELSSILQIPVIEKRSI